MGKRKMGEGRETEGEIEGEIEGKSGIFGRTGETRKIGEGWMEEKKDGTRGDATRAQIIFHGDNRPR